MKDQKGNEVELRKVLINGNWEMILPKHRADRTEWYSSKGWERARLDSIREHIDSNDVMYYVGAEEGDMPALIQKWGAKMVLFEPNSKVWSNIKCIYEANGLEDPWCFSGFASDKTSPGARIWRIFPPCSEGPVISDHGFKELGSPFDAEGAIPQIKLDDVSDFLMTRGVIPTCMSLDVEGSEWQVLKGAEQTILKHHPKIWMSIHPEFMFNQFRQYSGDLRNWVRDRGYNEKILAYDHELHVLYTPK